MGTANMPRSIRKRTIQVWVKICWNISVQKRREIFCPGISRLSLTAAGLPGYKEELQDLFGRVLAGYGEYAAANGWTDPDRLKNTCWNISGRRKPERSWISGPSEVFPEGEITVPPEQLEALAADLYGGYREYASSNGLPDVSRNGRIFR